MKAIITGASSGMGAEMARILSRKGYDVVLVARTRENLEKVAEGIKTKVDVVPLDLTIEANCYKLYDMYKDEDIDIFINCAGSGVYGFLDKTNMEDELQSIKLDVIAVQILTKLFYEKFMRENKGRIMNVSSIAAFQPGPLMASYYASKVYVYSLTIALYEEIRRRKRNVKVHVLCPGPTKTNFIKKCGVSFAVKEMSCKYVCEYAIKQMFKDKLIIIPGKLYKLMKFAERFSPETFTIKFEYRMQKKKVDRLVKQEKRRAKLESKKQVK